VVRGGAFNNHEDNVRAAFRNNNDPNNRNNNVGFRVVCAHIFCGACILAPAGNVTDRSNDGCVAEAWLNDSVQPQKMVRPAAWPVLFGTGSGEYRRATSPLVARSRRERTSPRLAKVGAWQLLIDN
jgi:hypothetical protein